MLTSKKRHLIQANPMVYLGRSKNWMLGSIPNFMDPLPTLKEPLKNVHATPLHAIRKTLK